MTQTEQMWIQPQVRVSQRDGDLILENPAALEAYPDNLALWLRQNAERFPARPFVVQRDAAGVWRGPTYAEALAWVNRLSNGLLAHGLDGSRPLAIMSENSVEMAMVTLAAMQVGIPVAPISYAYALHSGAGGLIKHILDLIDAPLAVMSNADLHMTKQAQWGRPGLELFAVSNAQSHPGVSPLGALELGDGTLSAEAEARFAAVRPETLAKVQFTSGSTNLPKGVRVTHGMMASNQTGIYQMWPFLTSDELVLDFLPWNHTFGGNFIFNMMLRHGGTYYVDRGNPTPAGLEITVKNILDVRPTVFFGVPRSYTTLYNRMQSDPELRAAFFSRLKFMFTAAAALDQKTFDGMQAMALAERGAPIPFFAAWGMTETSPDATLVYWPSRDARVIGLPIPGVTIKLAADPSGKRELRVKGACLSGGYYHNPEATAKLFDAEGYLRSSDAAALLDPHDPAAGLIFDGRLGEDFKLTSGTWVHNARMRASVNKLGQPYLLELVVAAPNRDYLAALVFPNFPPLRARFAEASARYPDDADFVRASEVRAFFAEVFTQHNGDHHSANSEHFLRCLLLAAPPRLEHNETTDKGYINQGAVLRRRADAVQTLYAGGPGVIQA